MKTTRKEIYRIYGKENVILLGYCEIQYIQNYLTKVGHTERVEGWPLIFSSYQNRIII